MFWILIVSLPVQGIAATINFPCTMAHPSMGAPAAETMDECDDPGMMMRMAQPEVQAIASAQVAQPDMPCDQASHQTHSSCRACSACCVGASAPPPFVLAILPTAHFADAYISPISSFTGWIPSRIERPPRS